MFKNLNPTDVTCVIAYDNDDLIPSCGGGLKLLHTSMLRSNQLIIYPYSLKTLRSFTKVRKQFSSASKLIIFHAYQICFMTLFATSPHEKLSRGFSLLMPVCIIPQSRPKRQ